GPGARRAADRLACVDVGHRGQPRSDQLRVQQGRRHRRHAGARAAARPRGRPRERRRARGHRDRDDRAHPRRHAAGRAPAELAAAGRPAGRRRGGDRVPRLAAGGWRQRPGAARVRPEHGGPMTAEMREVRLPEVPTLGSLYAQALGRMAQTVMTTRQPTTLPAVRYTVDDAAPDRDQLAEYQHLLGEPGTDVLPAGYVHVLAFPVAVAVMARADFPLPLLGMVHLANDVEQRAPLRLGDRLAVR